MASDNRVGVRDLKIVLKNSSVKLSERTISPFHFAERSYDPVSGVRSIHLDEFAAADLRGVVVVGERDAQLASLHVDCGLQKNTCYNIIDTDLEFDMPPSSDFLPTLNFFPPMVSMSHSLPTVNLLVTLAFFG